MSMPDRLVQSELECYESYVMVHIRLGGLSRVIDMS